MGILVAAAEVLTVGWFVFFTAVIVEQIRLSRGLEAPSIDTAGRTLIGSWRWAMIVGMPLMMAAETAFILGLFD